MRKFTKGLLIFALLLFVGGAGCMIAGFVMGITSGDLEKAIKGLPFIDFENHIMITDDKVIELPDLFEKDGIGGSQSFAGKEVKSIELDLNDVNCTIYETEEEQILVTTSDQSNVRILLTAGVLDIKKDANVFGRESETMEIYLPKDLMLEEFDLQAGAGNIVIESPIHARDISMEVGASSVRVNGKVTAEILDVELGAGMLSLDFVDADNISIENGAGQTNLGLAGQKDNYNVTIESAAGSVQYGGEAFAGVAKEYKSQPKDADKNIRIESALGEVNVIFKEEI